MKRILCLLFFFVAIAPPSYHQDGLAQDAETIHVNNVKATTTSGNTLADESSSTVDTKVPVDSPALIENLLGHLNTE